MLTFLMSIATTYQIVPLGNFLLDWDIAFFFFPSFQKPRNHQSNLCSITFCTREFICFELSKFSFLGSGRKEKLMATWWATAWIKR